MKLKKSAVSSLLGMVLVLLITPRIATAATQLQRQINQNFRVVPVGPHWGLWVKDLTTGKQLYARRSKEFFTPASTMKLVTAAVAVDSLTANFRFKTQLGWRGEVQNGRLQGDLYLRMRGDPTLTTKDLKRLFSKLKKAGIQSISGRIVVDTSRFQMESYGPGWMWDELSYSYAAPMGSIVLNENKFAIQVSAKKNSSRVQVKSHLPPGVIQVKNKARVVAKYDKWCPLTVYSNNMNRYRIGGCLVRGWGKQVRVLAVRRVWPYFKAELKQVLQKKGIVVGKGIVERTRPVNINWRLTHTSKPLSVLIHHMLKESDNLIADALFVEVGRHYSRYGGNWQGGALAVREFLQRKVGVNTKKIDVEDGSGVSRYNLVRPIQLAQLLVYLNRHPRLFKVIYPALPIAGKDGTLAWRGRSTMAKMRVHAKTGTMTGVSALAGYIKRKDGHRLAFVIMMNGWIGKIKHWRPYEDKLLTLLVTGN